MTAPRYTAAELANELSKLADTFEECGRDEYVESGADFGELFAGDQERVAAMLRQAAETARALEEIEKALEYSGVTLRSGPLADRVWQLVTLHAEFRARHEVCENARGRTP